MDKTHIESATSCSAETAGPHVYFLGKTNWLAQKLSIGPPLPVRFPLSVGRLEGGAVSSGLSENRRLRDVLIAKGTQVSYWEYTGSHDALTWRDSLADGLIALLGPERLQWLQ
jgi:enterochelin esterase family protein